MSALCYGSFPAYLNVKYGLQKRRQHFERIVMNGVDNYVEEVIRIKLTVGEIKQLQTTNKKLSQDYNQKEVDLHILKNKESANKEEICSLESRLLELKKEIAVKTEDQQQLLAMKSKSETDKEKSQKELVKTHEVFLKAIAYYKKKLHIRLRFEENGVILAHFLNISAPGCRICSLKLSHNDGKWSLLGTDPVLPSEKDLAHKLETTQDTQGFITHVRKLFMQLSSKKTKCATVKVTKKSGKCNA